MLSVQAAGCFDIVHNIQSLSFLHCIATNFSGQPCEPFIDNSSYAKLGITFSRHKATTRAKHDFVNFRQFSGNR